MRKIEFRKVNGDIQVYIDHSLFKTEENEINCLFKVLTEIIKANTFNGTVVISCKEKNIIDKLKRACIKYEENDQKILWMKNVMLDLYFNVEALYEMINLFYLADVSFDGEGVCFDNSKVGIIINDNDCSIFNLNKSRENLNYYKEQFANIIEIKA